MDELTKKLAAYRSTVKDVVAQGPFEPTWDSLTGYQVPDWYQDGKFGIFIHWGVYAVPAFGNEWYPRNMYLQGDKVWQHHQETYGPEFGYKDFIPQFTASQFDAEEWAALFRKAGAQFVVPVGEHHDGFQLYESQISRWNAKEMGPKRDVLQELADAVRKNWMVFGISSHRAEHWWFMNGGMTGKTDVQDPAFAEFYGPAMSKELPPNDQFLEDWLIRTCEMIDKFQPQLLWFDWWIEEDVFEPYRREMAAYYYNRAAEWNRGVAINYKYDAFPPGTAVFDVERGQLAGIRPEFWQTDTAVAKNSWGYTEGNDFKQPGDLIGDLVDIVSKNGALLLNIGPRADGTIPDEDQELLLAIGRWLGVNGEAVYGTRPCVDFGEGPTEVFEGAFQDTKRTSFTAQDVRFTTRTVIDAGVKHDVVYATILAIPNERNVTIAKFGEGSAVIPGSVGKVSLLGGGELEWKRDADGLHVALPDSLPSEHAISVRVDLA